jgi:hypothetical protein
VAAKQGELGMAAPSSLRLVSVSKISAAAEAAAVVVEADLDRIESANVELEAEGDATT